MVRPRRQWRERLAQRNVDKGGKSRLRRQKGPKKLWMRQIKRRVDCRMSEIRGKIKTKQKNRRFAVFRGCSRRETVPTTLQWERLPERQQRTQEEPAPCEPGLSALHDQETAARTRTHTHTQNTAQQGSCCHNNSPCALLIGTACLARQQQGERQTHKQWHHRQTCILQEPACDWHRYNGWNMKIHKAPAKKKKKRKEKWGKRL